MGVIRQLSCYGGNMEAVIDMPDHMHAQAEQRAAEFGISLAELALRLFERELGASRQLDDATPGPLGDAAPEQLDGLEAVCGMVTGTPFDMARDGDLVIAEAYRREAR